ncbi:MAG: PLDc N-terminal domain-containing protein [Bacillota bacterium]
MVLALSLNWILENWLMVLPLLLLEWTFKAYAFLVMKREGAKPPGPFVWAVIILLVSMLGPLFFLAIGRKGYAARVD